MVGGAGYFMATLESELKKVGVKPLHAFTLREVVETHQNGEVVKTALQTQRVYRGLTISKVLLGFISCISFFLNFKKSL